MLGVRFSLRVSSRILTLNGLSILPQILISNSFRIKYKIKISFSRESIDRGINWENSFADIKDFSNRVEQSYFSIGKRRIFQLNNLGGFVPRNRITVKKIYQIIKQIRYYIFFLINSIEEQRKDGEEIIDSTRYRFKRTRENLFFYLSIYLTVGRDNPSIEMKIGGYLLCLATRHGIIRISLSVKRAITIINYFTTNCGEGKNLPIFDFDIYIITENYTFSAKKKEKKERNNKIPRDR